MGSSSAPGAHPVWDEGQSPGKSGTPAPIALPKQTSGGFKPRAPTGDFPASLAALTLETSLEAATSLMKL